MANALGLGDLPILNERNRLLNEKLISLQLETLREKSCNEGDTEQVENLDSHYKRVKESLENICQTIQSQRRELDSEQHLSSLNSSMKERLTKDLQRISNEREKVAKSVEELAVNIDGRKVVLELLEDEFDNDSNNLSKEFNDIDEKEDDLVALLKYQQEDVLRIKEHHLRLEKMRDKLALQTEHLKQSSADNRMKQLEVNRAAEVFRSLHRERQEIRLKWSMAMSLIKVRNLEIQNVNKTISSRSEELIEAKNEYNERLAFLERERMNLMELERIIGSLEKQNHNLETELESKESEFEEYESSVGLKKREVARLGLEIDKKRAQLKERKTEYNRKVQKAEKSKSHINEMIQKKELIDSGRISAEDRSKEVERLFETEKRQMNSLQNQVDKIRYKKLTKENELKEIEDQMASVSVALKGLKSERQKLLYVLNTLKGDASKKEEINLKHSYDLTKIEREIARLKGEELTAEEKSVLDVQIEELKNSICIKNEEKKHLDRQIYKMSAEVRKLDREIDRVNSEKNLVRDKLQETRLIIDQGKIKYKSQNENLESYLLEKQMIEIMESKAESEYKYELDKYMELGKEDVCLGNEIRERREELQDRKDVLLSQERIIRDQVSEIKIKTREKEDRSCKLHIRYDILLKSLGEVRRFEGEEVPSHAYHLVRLAQEKAELLEKAAQVSTFLQKEEKDLKELEKTLYSLRDSNVHYREKSNQSNKTNEEEAANINNELKAVSGSITSIKLETTHLENQISLKEVKNNELNSSLDNRNRIYGDKSEELKKYEKQNSCQKEKIERASRLRVKVANTFYAKNQSDLGGRTLLDIDLEMNVRIAKDKQKLALLKARNLCKLNEMFEEDIQYWLDTLSIAMPILTRLEDSASNASSRRQTSEKGGSRGHIFYRRASSEHGRNNDRANILLMKLDPIALKNSIQTNSATIGY